MTIKLLIMKKILIAILIVPLVSQVRGQVRQLMTIGNAKVYKVHLNGADSVVVFKSKFSVDADGSPRAYGPDDSGLDKTASAGSTGDWSGVVTDNGDSSGNPVLQGENDPHPGMYISTTSLQDSRFSVRDTRRYVNSEIIPYVALPAALRNNAGIRRGDLCWVYNTENQKSSFAIYADSGPAGKLGEGSIALAELLGLSGNPRNGGTSDSVILYVVFPRSSMGERYIPSVLQIHDKGIQIFLDEHMRLIRDTLSF